MKRLILVVLAVSGCSTFDAGKHKPKLELVYAGLFFGNHRDAEYVNDENSTSGYRIISDPVMICETKEIPMKLGMTFGITFKIIGLPESKKVPVVVETSHPEIVSPSGSESTVDVWESTTSHYADGGHIGGAMFIFELPEELKPGLWDISVKAFDQEVGSEFYVSDEHKVKFANCHAL